LDWSGILPASSLVIRVRLRGGISKTPKEPEAIGLRDEMQRATLMGPAAGVSRATSGIRASDGSGWPV
jgi:hypothetical protein